MKKLNATNFIQSTCISNSFKTKTSLAGLEVFLQHCKAFSLLAIVGNHGAGAANNLAGLALSINLAKTSPLSQLLGLRNSNQVDALLRTQSFNELLVVRLVAVIGEDAKLSLSTLNRAACFMQTTREAIMGIQNFSSLDPCNQVR